jgi:hypothetical protein
MQVKPVYEKRFHTYLPEAHSPDIENGGIAQYTDFRISSSGCHYSRQIGADVDETNLLSKWVRCPRENWLEAFACAAADEERELLLLQRLKATDFNKKML